MQGPRGEQHDNSEPEEGLQSGLETRTWFQRKDFEVKNALKADLYSWERRIQDLQEQVPINIWQEGKKRASGKCQGFHQDKLVQEC